MRGNTFVLYLAELERNTCSVTRAGHLPNRVMSEMKALRSAILLLLSLFTRMENSIHKSVFSSVAITERGSNCRWKFRQVSACIRV